MVKKLKKELNNNILVFFLLLQYLLLNNTFMKKNQILNEELTRIWEIMGVSSPNNTILTESWIDDIIQLGVKKLSTEVGDDVTKLLTKFESEFEITPGIITKKDLSDLIGSNAVKSEAALAKVINNMGSDGLISFTNKMWQNMPNLNKSLNSALQKIETKISVGKSISEADAKDLFGDWFDATYVSPGAKFDRLTESLKDKFVREGLNEAKTKDLIAPDLPPPRKPQTNISDYEPEKIEEILARNRKLYGEEFRKVENSINTLPIDQKIKDQMLVSWSEYRGWTVTDLAKESQKLLQNLRTLEAEKWSWLKKTFTDVTTGKFKVSKAIWTTAGIGFTFYTLYHLIKWVGLGGEVSNESREFIRKELGLGEGLYSDGLDGFKKYIKDTGGSAGFTIEQIGDDYILRPIDYNTNPNYYKEFTNYYRYTDNTFECYKNENGGPCQQN
jgi:hypothetical protein